MSLGHFFAPGWKARQTAECCAFVQYSYIASFCPARSSRARAEHQLLRVAAYDMANRAHLQSSAKRKGPDVHQGHL